MHVTPTLMHPSHRGPPAGVRVPSQCWQQAVKLPVKTAIYALTILFFFNENNLNFGQLWANLDPIFIKYRVVSLIDQLLVVF